MRWAVTKASSNASDRSSAVDVLGCANEEVGVPGFEVDGDLGFVGKDECQPHPWRRSLDGGDELRRKDVDRRGRAVYGLFLGKRVRGDVQACDRTAASSICPGSKPVTGRGNLDTVEDLLEGHRERPPSGSHDAENRQRDIAKGSRPLRD